MGISPDRTNFSAIKCPFQPFPNRFAFFPHFNSCSELPSRDPPTLGELDDYFSPAGWPSHLHRQRCPLPSIRYLWVIGNKFLEWAGKKKTSSIRSFLHRHRLWREDENGLISSEPGDGLLQRYESSLWSVHHRTVPQSNRWPLHGHRWLHGKRYEPVRNKSFAVGEGQMGNFAWSKSISMLGSGSWK